MKGFLIRVLVFSFPVIGVMLTLEGLQRILPNNYTYKKALLEHHASDIETLILGNSHTYLGINPAYLDGKAFNMAYTAQTLCFDKFLLRKYLTDLPNLKNVILPVSYSSLANESYLNPGDYDKSYYYAFYYGSKCHVDKLSPRRFSAVSLYTVKRSVDRTYKYFMRGDSLVEFTPSGWYKTDQQRDLNKNGKDAGYFHDRYYDTSLIPQNLAYLEEMIALCKDNGIDLFLVSMPMWESYMAHINPDRYNFMVATMDSLSNHHHIPYLNFTNDTRFVRDDFFDANHLRSRGAVKFTQILNSIMTQEYLAKK